MILSDNPIRRPEDDLLGRATIAQAFAQRVLALHVTEGIVVGVLGAWGSGKTSFVNLARGEFERAGVDVLDFNPWMFSGTEQLVDSFFAQLAAQLKISRAYAKVGKYLEDYGEAFSKMAWLPLGGTWIQRVGSAGRILGRILQPPKGLVGERKRKLEKSLARAERPIVVVLDDIDRLSTSEIRDVFRLVRLTASFPNVVYIVAFDRARVEDALTEQGLHGRDYLEKILQLTVDLPGIPANVLNKQVLLALDTTLAPIERRGPFDERVWPDVFMDVIRPLIRNMRDVRRYALALHGTVATLQGQIALADVLALEAVRIFLPDVFHHLHNATEALTTTSGSREGVPDSPQLKKQIDALIKAAGQHNEVVLAIVRQLFPAATRHIAGSHYGPEWEAQWLRERRVAHGSVLRLYLERVAGEQMEAFTRAEQAFALLTDREDLDKYFRSFELAQVPEIIASLEAFEDRFKPEHVVPATIVLLNLLADLPEQQRGMSDFGARLVVARVTFRLLRSLNSPTAVESAVRLIMPELRSLSSKLELISEIGYREGVGHKLVPQGTASELEKDWRDEVRCASLDDLVSEREPLAVLLRAKRDSDASEPVLSIDSSPRLTLALLRAARSEVLSQSVGSRAVQRTPRLAWEALTELYGDTETLTNRIEDLRMTRPEETDDLLELAKQYAGGQPPGDIGDV